MTSITDDVIARRAVMTWETYGLPCAITPGFIGLNGYVQLPEGHAARFWESGRESQKKSLEGMAALPMTPTNVGAVLSARERLSSWDDEDGRDWNIAHDRVEVDVHGGLTYGPDEFGWIGFDTAHGFDYWPKKEIWPYLDSKEAKYSWATMNALHGPGLFNRGEHHVEWSLARLKNEVERLALQLSVYRKDEK